MHCHTGIKIVSKWAWFLCRNQVQCYCLESSSFTDELDSCVGIQSSVIAQNQAHLPKSLIPYCNRSWEFKQKLRLRKRTWSHEEYFTKLVEVIFTTWPLDIELYLSLLYLFQPIMALFRPHPGEPNRVYFNWAHWGVGTLAHTLSSKSFSQFKIPCVQCRIDFRTYATVKKYWNQI